MGEDFLKDKLDSAARIRQIRERAGFTQEQFAEILGISLSGYKKIENAENQISLNGLRKLERKLQVSADYILFGANESPDVMWERIQNCTDSDKLYLMIKLLFYFANNRNKAFYVKEDKANLDDAIFRVMEELRKYKVD